MRVLPFESSIETSTAWRETKKKIRKICALCKEACWSKKKPNNNNKKVMQMKRKEKHIQIMWRWDMGKEISPRRQHIKYTILMLIQPNTILDEMLSFFSFSSLKPFRFYRMWRVFKWVRSIMASNFLFFGQQNKSIAATDE